MCNEHLLAPGFFNEPLERGNLNELPTRIHVPSRRKRSLEIFFMRPETTWRMNWPLKFYILHVNAFL